MEEQCSNSYCRQKTGSLNTLRFAANTHRLMIPGTAILGMALGHARSLGLQKVLVTCDDDNLGSIGVIENCGGVLGNRVFGEEDQKEVRRYWIAL